MQGDEREGIRAIYQILRDIMVLRESCGVSVESMAAPWGSQNQVRQHNAMPCPMGSQVWTRDFVCGELASGGFSHGEQILTMVYLICLLSLLGVLLYKGHHLAARTSAYLPVQMTYRPVLIDACM